MFISLLILSLLHQCKCYMKENQDADALLPVLKPVDNEKKSFLDFSNNTVKDFSVDGGEKHWSKTILNGLNAVKRKGWPGTIIVFDDLGAQPILTGSHQTDVVIAGAAVGKGKLLAFAQTLYADQITKDSDPFYQRIQKWLVGRPLRPDEVHDVTYENHPNIKAFASAKVLKWIERSYANKSDAFYEEVEKFMMNGGSVVIGATMWGHLQGTDMTVHDMCTNNFLKKFGLYYTSLTARGWHNFNVSENKASLGGVDKILAGIMQKLQGGGKMSYSGLWKEFFVRCYPWFPTEKKLEIRKQIESHFKCCPLTKKEDWPVRSAKMRFLVAVLEQTSFGKKLPGIQWYPGDFRGEPPISATGVPVSVTSTPTQKCYPTGYYAPAGQKILISRVTKSAKTNWRIRIGSQSDSLSGHSTIRRWPNIVMRQKLSESSKRVEITSPYGGLIYLCGPQDSSNISLMLSNVVEAPHFNLNDPKSVKDWPNRRIAPGLWADISGKFVTFTVPSGNVRDLKDPAPIMEFWDSLLESYYDLKGRNILEARKEWIVMDIQPWVGYMHAGYPIVAAWGKHEGLPYFFNYSYMIKNGAWALYHELGHNVQEKVWTFRGTTEVTCNIFLLYGFEKFNNRSVPEDLDLRFGEIPEMLNFLYLRFVKKYLNNPDYDGHWKKDAGVALMVYVQLAHHFGWNAYKKAFRMYIERNDLIKTDQEKIDFWVIYFSAVVNKNLAPLFEYWAIPFSDYVPRVLKRFMPFLPDDKFTRFAESRATIIREKYGIKSK